MQDCLPTTFTHLTVKFNKYPLYLLLKTDIVMPWATCTRHTDLIHRFLCFTAKTLLTFRRFEIVVKLSPNSDSATRILRRLYCGSVRTLLLLAIAKALRLRFGIVHSLKQKVHTYCHRCYPQVSLFRYPDLFIAPQLAGLAILHWVQYSIYKPLFNVAAVPDGWCFSVPDYTGRGVPINSPNSRPLGIDF